MTVKSFMDPVDRRILGSRVVRDVLVVGTENIQGAFWSTAREIGFSEGAVETVALSFDCRHSALLDDLEEGDTVEVVDRGTYRFIRQTPEGGDESGLVTLVLGEVQG